MHYVFVPLYLKYMCKFFLSIKFNITAVVLVSSWSFSLIKGGESQELPSELIYWKGRVFVKCLILREITIAFICCVLHQQR